MVPCSSVPPPCSDALLLQRLVNNHAVALTTIADRYVGLLTREATRLVGDPATSEAIAWSAIAALWDSRHRVRSQRLYGFLLTVTRRLALKHLREAAARLRRNGRWLLENPVGAFPSPASATEVVFLADELWSAIADLPDRQREAFLLVKVNGLSHRLAATAMGLSPRSVEHYVELAIRKLRHALRGVAREWLYADGA